VFLHNMRIEAVERLGFGFDAVSKMNPKIVYCSAIGFGQGGRYRDLPAYDDVIQAASGLVGLTQKFGQDPQLLPTILADKVGALYSVYGILAALVHQANGGDKAIKVEMSMFEALASFVLNEHLSGATFSNEGSTGYHRILSPNRKPHRTKDGWIVVLPYTSENWRALIAELGRSDIMTQDWFADRIERAKRANYLYGEIAPAMAEKITAEWLEILNRLDVPCSRVNSLDDLLEDPHLADVGFFKPQGNFPPFIARSLPQPVVFSGIESKADKPAPVHGSDTREILRACGYTDADIETMIKGGVVATSGDRNVRVA
jgi:crotonobetainyl-CoA:carnitine CoA-transferase CaiB-like acyl-CoA transferase